MPPKVDGVYVHGPECDCDWCEEDLQLMRTGRIRSEAQVFRIAREYFGLDGRDGAA